MSKVLNEVLLANREYSNDFDKGDLAMPIGPLVSAAIAEGSV